MRLEGKAALVTGAGQGIGRAIALAFAKEGADVVVNDRHPDEVEKVAEELRPLGHRALAVQADVSKMSEVNQMVEKAINSFKKIDILVNNAGVADVKPFIEITESDWDRILGVNLKSVFNCTKAVINQMIARRRGCIISMSSMAGVTGTANHVHYSATKGGIIAFTKALAKEVGQYGITCNAVAPGTIDTPILANVPESVKENYRARTVLGRLGKPEEVAAACVYLASEDASYMTGQVLNISGGYFI